MGAKEVQASEDALYQHAWNSAAEPALVLWSGSCDLPSNARWLVRAPVAGVGKTGSSVLATCAWGGSSVLGSLRFAARCLTLPVALKAPLPAPQEASSGQGGLATCKLVHDRGRHGDGALDSDLRPTTPLGHVLAGLVGMAVGCRV